MIIKKELFQEYEEWCRENRIVSEFARFHPVLEVVALGNTIALDLSTPEDIWTNLTGKNHNMIRKARSS